MGLLLKVNTLRPSIRASEVAINFSRQVKGETSSSQVKIQTNQMHLISYITALLYASQGSRNSSNP